MPLQTGELATRLGVTRQTVRSWAGRFSEYLSPGASAIGQPRTFTEKDVRALRAVALWRKQFNSSYDDIEGQLSHGAHLELSLEEPQPFEDEPPPETLAETALTLHGQYQDLIAHWRTLADSHRQELTRVTAERDKAQAQVVELSRQMGELTGRLSVFQELRALPAPPTGEEQAPQEEPPEVAQALAEVPPEEPPPIEELQVLPDEPSGEEPALIEQPLQEQALPQEPPIEELAQQEEPPVEEPALPDEPLVEEQVLPDEPLVEEQVLPDEPPIEERRWSFWRWLFGR